MTPNTPDTEAKIIGFYGFKGGAGRSLLLANLAGVMAAQDKKILVIDCDLEAPGLGDYSTQVYKPSQAGRKSSGFWICLWTGKLNST
jgi:hypothetical protein